MLGVLMGTLHQFKKEQDAIQQTGRVLHHFVDLILYWLNTGQASCGDRAETRTGSSTRKG